MLLTAAQISENYEQCYRRTAQLIGERSRGRGYELDAEAQDFVDLCQSVVGHESVVLLLQAQEFSNAAYDPLLKAVIDEVRRLFFPDTAKRRFLALDALDAEVLQCEPEMFDEPEEMPEAEEALILESLESMLPEADYAYLRNVVFPAVPDWQRELHYWISSSTSAAASSNREALLEKIALLRRFYPEGNIPLTAGLNAAADLSPAEIIAVFLNVYIGIERAFPVNFLQYDGEARARILIRFLVEEILQTTPEAVLDGKDEIFFIRHKLQNVYRFFNYSANRALRNAYPEEIPPWLHSRSSARYWEDAANRIEAVRWLMEERLKLAPDSFYRHNISKSVFSRHGLSYMFNQYYNSVSRALAETYPHLEPWELGKVPYDYWSDERTARAIRWMVAKQGWEVDSLPERVRTRELNRKTFSEFGLATLFEKKFAKNIYRAISAAWPGRFQPWELGKVSSDYWERRGNVYQASMWIAEKEGLDVHQIPPAIRRKDFTEKALGKYSIGAALKKLCQGKLERIFAPLFWKEHKTYLEEHKLLRKIALLKNAQPKSNLFELLLYGFFMGEVQRNTLQNNRRYDRIARRIQRRSIQYSD